MARSQTETRTETHAPAAAPTGTAVAVRPMDAFKKEIALREPMLRPMLPAHISFEKFQAIVVAAVGSNPKLLECSRASLLKASMEAAELGLSLNPSLGEGDILPVWSKDGSVAQFRPRYMGLMKLARQSGEVVDIYAHVVRDGDEFDYSLGLDKKLVHVPAKGDRGEITHAYVVWQTKDGIKSFEVMDRKQLDDVRSRSEGFKAFQAGRIKSTPWATDEEEMSRKSAVRKGSKYMPRSAEAFQRAVALDTMRDIGRDVTIDQTGEIVADAEDITSPPTPATSGRQLDGLEQRVSGAAHTKRQDPVVIQVPQTANGFDWKQWADAAIAAIAGVTDAAWLDRWEALNKTALNNCEFNAHEHADRVAEAMKAARASPPPTR